MTPSGAQCNSCITIPVNIQSAFVLIFVVACSCLQGEPSGCLHLSVTLKLCHYTIVNSAFIKHSNWIFLRSGRYSAKTMNICLRSEPPCPRLTIKYLRYLLQHRLIQRKLANIVHRSVDFMLENSAQIQEICAVTCWCECKTYVTITQFEDHEQSGSVIVQRRGELKHTHRWRLAVSGQLFFTVWQLCAFSWRILLSKVPGWRDRTRDWTQASKNTPRAMSQKYISGLL